MKQEHIVEYIIDGDDLKYSDDHGRLVRCKDCAWIDPVKKSLNVDESEFVYCIYLAAYKPRDWYCAMGRGRR